MAIYHDSPLSVYIAKALTTAAAFDGSGDMWFKILDIGPIFPGGTWDLKRKLPFILEPHQIHKYETVNYSETYTFNTPACIPSGDYLLRIQQLASITPGRQEFRNSILSVLRSRLLAVDQRTWVQRWQSLVLSVTRILDTLSISTTNSRTIPFLAPRLRVARFAFEE